MTVSRGLELGTFTVLGAMALLAAAGSPKAAGAEGSMRLSSEPTISRTSTLMTAPLPSTTRASLAGGHSFAGGREESAGPAQFPVAVWLQDPAGNATDYKSLGATTFLGLWNWPEDDGKWPGWAQASLEALAANDMDAYAGESPAAIERTLGMPGQDVVSGWLAGDEPDMFGPRPDAWARKIAAMKAVSDRPVAANFGLGFGGFGWWYDHISDEDRQAWCSPVDLPSVDYYGMTNPEPAENKGAWTYGRAINNLRKACGDEKPLGSFVEVSEIDESGTAQTPQGIRDAAWNAVINGADSINWFVHDFKCNPECGPSVWLYEDKWAANRAAVNAVNTDLHRWASVLTTPDIQEAAATTGIPLDVLVKRVGDTNYVFAQATGGPDAPQGHKGEATITVRGRSFPDTWSPYQVRIYSWRD